VTGVAFGVAELVAYGVVVGVAVGVVFDVAKGAAGVAKGVAYVVAFSVAAGVARGVVFGVAKGPYFVAFCVTSALTISHLLVYPIQFFLSGVSWVFIRWTSLPLLHLFWHLSPVRWDEVVILPLPGLSRLLVNLRLRDPKLGKEAIDEVFMH